MEGRVGKGREEKGGGREIEKRERKRKGRGLKRTRAG